MPKETGGYVTKSGNAVSGITTDAKGNQVNSIVSATAFEAQLAQIRKQRQIQDIGHYNDRLKLIDEEIRKQEAIVKSEKTNDVQRLQAQQEIATKKLEKEKVVIEQTYAYEKEAIQVCADFKSKLEILGYDARKKAIEGLKEKELQNIQEISTQKTAAEIANASLIENKRKELAEQYHLDDAGTVGGLSHDERATQAQETLNSFINNIDTSNIDELNKQLTRLVQDLTSHNNQLDAMNDAEQEKNKKLAPFSKDARKALVDDAKKKKSVARGELDDASLNKMNFEQQHGLYGLSDAEKANKENELSDDERDEYERLKQQQGEAESEYKTASMEAFLVNFGANAVDAIGKGIGNAIKAVTSTVDNDLDLLVEGASEYNARIQGAGITHYWDVATENIRMNLGYSSLVKQSDVMKNLKELAEKGVAYNIEQRAFLQTISDKIATTFDAFDSNLLRIIRLQQADSTSARLGMEAQLTQFFNSMYQDTSYLGQGSTGGMYDTVYANLIDATSQMTRDQTISFEYTVQKWLGSLSSLGISDNAVTSLSQAIGYLAAGDVTSLSSNTEMQNLLAMSAANAGLDYAKMLTNGIDSDTTNKLLESMVMYLKDIADSEENLVVKQAYGDVFGMTMSDFRAFQNLTSTDINTISGTSMTYSDAMSELSQQMVLAVARTPIAEQVQTLYENLMMSVSKDIKDNPLLYGTWLVNGVFEELTGGIAIPEIGLEAYGFGFDLDLNTTLSELVKVGIIGADLIGSAPKMLASLGMSTLAGLGANTWGSSDYTSRGKLFEGTYASEGSGFVGITAGSLQTQSYSASVGNASSSDFQQTTTAGGISSSESMTDVVSNDSSLDTKSDEDKTNNDIYEKLDEILEKMSESTTTQNVIIENVGEIATALQIGVS